MGHLTFRRSVALFLFCVFLSHVPRADILHDEYLHVHVYIFSKRTFSEPQLFLF